MLSAYFVSSLACEIAELSYNANNWSVISRFTVDEDQKISRDFDNVGKRVKIAVPLNQNPCTDSASFVIAATDMAPENAWRLDCGLTLESNSGPC